MLHGKLHHSHYAENGLEVSPIDGRIGAEVGGINLSKIEEGDISLISTIYNLMLRHKVIFFRRQNLTPEQHYIFASLFGKINEHHPLLPSKAGFPTIFEIDYATTGSQYQSSGDDDKERYQGRNIAWHENVTFTEEPPKCSILNGVIIPPTGVDTMWSNHVASFNALSEQMKNSLRWCHAIHNTSDFSHNGIKATTKHPVVITHPETGEESLYVNQVFTKRITEFSKTESDMLLAFLFKHTTRYDFTVNYRWTQGDIVFSDNRVTQHAVVANGWSSPWLVNGVALSGTRPISSI